jgi:hypothetical protein
MIIFIILLVKYKLIIGIIFCIIIVIILAIYFQNNKAIILPTEG